MFREKFGIKLLRQTKGSALLEFAFVARLLLLHCHGNYRFRPCLVYAPGHH